ncbi:hypothetical protein PFISCL1PPCAC_13961, partial [Pristionchus fissidentatus]
KKILKIRHRVECRSPFLKFFEKCNDPNKRRCTLCPLTPFPTEIRYVYGSKRVSTLLKEHMANHPEELGALLVDDARYSTAKRLLVRALATGNVSFAFANNSEFRSFVKTLDPTFIMPDRRALSTTILDSEYIEAYRSVVDALTGSCASITCDHWTSADSVHSLMGGTAHIINKSWRREMYVISLDEVHGSHNSEQVSAYLSKLQREYKMESIEMCVTDNATVMTSGVGKADLDRLGCILHACHLFVHDCLRDFPPFQPIIDTVRKVAVHLHRSRISWQKLKSELTESACKNQTKIQLEIRVRWGSMLRMLRTFNDQIGHLDAACAAAKVNPLSDEQGMILNRLVTFLSSVDEFSVKVN